MQLHHKIWTPGDFANESQSLAALRIKVFHDYPYLYDGNLAYEENYLKSYQHDEAIVVAVYDKKDVGDYLVGAATGSPMHLHAAEFAEPFKAQGYDIDSLYYCGESVLLSDYRGQGIGHLFFDEREKKAKSLGKTWICFCSVMREDNHPLKPTGYRSLNGFWQKRGYKPLADVIARFSWKDVRQSQETEKSLQFWIKKL